MKTEMNNLIKVLTAVLLLLGLSMSIACSSNSTNAPEISNSPAGKSESNQSVTSSLATGPQTASQSPVPQNAVSVVVAGYINHGPLQPTVKEIKDVMAKYGDKVAVTWIDLGTKDGIAYFKQNGLTAHMNVIINGIYKYKVNGKDVVFQWFEGTQWTKQDLDAVLSSLIDK